MGHGIAYAAALAGCEVVLTDARAEAVPQALDRIAALTARGAARGKVVTGRVVAVPEIPAAVSDADIVIEAVVEDLAIKQRLFVDVEHAAPRDALLASNTSSLSIADISSVMSEPARIVGILFLFLAHAMKIVDVVTLVRDSSPS